MTAKNLMVIGILFLLAGCMKPVMIPERGSLSIYKHAHIVAMEPRPLGVPPHYYFGFPGFMERGFGVYNTVVIFFEMPAASKRGGEFSQTLQEILNSEDIWVPTTVLTKEAAAILAGNKISSDIAPDIKPFPDIKDRSYTVHMENWFGPIRSWYNNADPVSEYSSNSSDQTTFILEVGIIDYHLIDNELLLQVVIKMIDPASGRVIGRTRASNIMNMPQIGPTVEQAFADNAKCFKETFIKEGHRCLEKCLADLGLIQQQS